MSLAWFFRFTDRTHFLVPAGIVLLLGGLSYSVLLAFTEGDFARQLFAPRHLGGTVALFVLLPAYLTAMLPLQRRRTEETLSELSAIARPSDVAEVNARLARAPGLSWIGVALGFSIGLVINPEILGRMYKAGNWPAFDVAFILGACGPGLR